MAKRYFFISALVLAACAPSAPTDADYFAAVERFWPNVQAEFKSQSDFYNRHAEGFREGAELRRDVAARLGRADDGASTDGVAKQSQANAEAALWLSNAKLTSISNIRCASAEGLSGENCEMDVFVTGADGKDHKMGGAWRFDEVDGQLTIVGFVQK